MTQLGLFSPTNHGEQPVEIQPYSWGPAARDIDTSVAAAEAIAPKVDTLRARALEAIKRRPMTADEVAAYLGESILAIRPRVTELGRLGYIVATTERRANASGKMAAVWRACDE